MIYPLVGGVDVSDEGIKERASRDEVLMHGIARDARFEGGQSAKDHSFLSVQRLQLFRPPPNFTPGRRDCRLGLPSRRYVETAEVSALGSPMERSTTSARQHRCPRSSRTLPSRALSPGWRAMLEATRLTSCGSPCNRSDDRVNYLSLRGGVKRHQGQSLPFVSVFCDLKLSIIKKIMSHIP